MTAIAGIGDFGLSALLQQALDALTQTEDFKDQAGIYASLAKNQFEEKGNWNADTNTPHLTADATIGQTGDRLQRYIITVPGVLQFNIIDHPAGSNISNGFLIQHPNGQWFYDPGDSTLINRILPFEMNIKFREKELQVYDNNGYITFRITTSGVTQAASIETNSLKVGGITVNADTYADKGLFDLLNSLFIIRKDGTLEFNDPNGYSAAKLNALGMFLFANLYAKILSADQLTTLKSQTDDLTVTGMSVKANESGHLEVKDKNGYILWSSKPADPPRPFGYFADVNHFMTYGQSLSVGQGGGATTVSTRSNVITFFKGPFMYLHDGDGTRYTDFKPSAEEINETPCTSMGNEISRQIEVKTGLTIGNPGLRYDVLVSAAGQGGYSLAMLSKGTAPYTRWLQGITNGKSLANSKNRTYNASGVLWMQGEAETGQRMHPSAYRDALRKLRNDMVADVKAVNPAQKNELIFLVNQLSSFNATADQVPYPDIALMLHNIAINEPGFYPGVVMYTFNYLDNTHLNGYNEYAKVGTLAAHIMNKIVCEGVEWKGIYIKSTKIEGRMLDVEFGVPVEPLVLDTSWVSDPGHFGFRLFAADGTEQTLSSEMIEGVDTSMVKVIRPNTVRIVSSANILPGMKLTYALNGTPGLSGRTTGPRGCLRDSQGNTLKYKPGTDNFRLDNYCPHFSHTIKS